MAGSTQAPLARQARLLSKIVKLVRKERRLTSAEVAQGMGIALRTYQDFEAGRREFDFNKVRLFAKATRADAVGILLALHYNWPELALILLDNKMATAFFIVMRDLHEEVGPRLGSVPPALLVSAFRSLGDEIRKLFARQDASAEDYISRAIAKSYEAPDPQDEGSS
ncbi:helix-turn-helix transcriptional regulator [Caulobacter sp. BE254]|uniref:helix-turn-helix domain-containing protein n=1 Tax=Caulobacter sp. BE254 TaxID=2817720 RepID=UPI0028612786|nr:helix-turn-helix transcriptional regulator [Caulobacter sp. BE254]MDR7117349.1 transcriptional regulator with XRE-family HTH domain [Caulobacter sp. BE254]